MTLEKAIKVLTEHNIWRREPSGTGGYGQIQDPREIGLAIDFAVEKLEQIELILLKLEKLNKTHETPGSTPN
jgi:hypothetical protein